MKTLGVVVAVMTVLKATTVISVGESSSTGNVQALAGQWRPIEYCQQLLDPDLVLKRQDGFEITIDEQLGDSHRKAATADGYYDNYVAFIKKNGHKPVASGFIKFDSGGEGELLISQKDGSLYLWYGVAFIDNPRIFIGRGLTAQSAETFVIEWTASCSESPVALEREFATVVYERVDRVSGNRRIQRTTDTPF